MECYFSDLNQDDFKNVPLKYHPEFRKYFHLLQSGLSKRAVRQLMIKDGKDNDLYVLELNPNVPLDKKHRHHYSGVKDGELPLRDDPEYSKYFAMLATGASFETLEQLALKEGKDPDVLELDPSRSLASQTDTLKKEKKKSHARPNKEPPLLKDDPRYSRYFEMLRTGIPVQSVKGYMAIDGRETSVLDLDPTLPLETQKHKLTGSAAATIAMNKIKNSLARSSLPLSSSNDFKSSFSIQRQVQHRNTDSDESDSDFDDNSSVQSLGSIANMASAVARANAEVLAMIQNSLNDAVEEEDEEKKMHMLSNLSLVMESSCEWNEYSQDLQTLTKTAAFGDNVESTDLEPKESSDTKITSALNQELPLEKDPEYFKYFFMLAHGISPSTMEQLMIKDGKDPEVLKLDPSKSLASQMGRKKKQ